MVEDTGQKPHPPTPRDKMVEFLPAVYIFKRTHYGKTNQNWCKISKTE